jgi:murein L,D-transpeptidase YafK
LKLRALLESPALRYTAATVLVAALCGGALVMSSRGGQAGSVAPAVSALPAPALNGKRAAFGPEALLLKTLHEVSNKRLDVAASEIDKIITAYPNFRLAHLIKGDLLLARARPLTTVGNAPGAPVDQLEELREEARARLARTRQPHPAERVPLYLVQLQPAQRHALVVDTAKSTLYVFENGGGEARYVTDYYVSIGKNGIDKVREGDNKTPLGVYHVTGALTREKLSAAYGRLAEQYGVGALPISYPNEWDRREGRNGSGIWLHGVPLDTYSRPPRASNGCVALTNEDFKAVSNSVQIGVTPVIIANGVDWVAPDAVRGLRRELVQQVERWRSDWESRDTEKYLAHYAENFSSGGIGLAQWSEQKRKVNAGKTWIRLKLDRVSIFLYPGRNDLAVLTFEQDYASSNLVSQMRKRQYWIRERGAWRILQEGAA